MDKFITSNIEKFNVRRAKNTDDLVMNIVKKYEIVDSIKKLDKLIPERSYGAVWKAVKRLNDMGDIIVKEIYDEIAGVRKKMIFMNQGIIDRYLNEHKITSTVNKVPDYHANLDELFKMLMREPEKNDPDADDAQIYILDKLKAMGVSISDMDMLEKRAKELMKNE